VHVDACLAKPRLKEPFGRALVGADGEDAEIDVVQQLLRVTLPNFGTVHHDLFQEALQRLA